MKIILLLSTVCIIQVFADSATLRKFIPQSQFFGAEIYKELLKTKSGNFMVSPLSLEIIMALVAAGAKGSTATELQRGLRLPKNQETTNEVFSELTQSLRSTNLYQLTTANRIFVNEDYKINNEYRKLASSVYNAGIENLNFNKGQEAAGLINDWVERQTNDKIRNIVNPSTLNNDVKLLLVNTIYFNANWSTQFDPIFTKNGNFYVNNQKSIDVQMMQLTEYVNYYECETLDAQFVELPYIGDEVSMVIALPKSKDGLAALEDRIFDVISHKKFNQERVKIKIPKFSTETSIEMTPILENLGIQKSFTSEANFSGIGNGSLAISSVLQKTFINVTESGTEAAAATTVLVALLSIPALPRPPMKTFTADHPFTYYIIDRTHGTILFIGRVADF